MPLAPTNKKKKKYIGKSSRNNERLGLTTDWSCKSGYWKMENWKMSFEKELFSFVNIFIYAKSLMISLTNSVKGKFINVCPGAWSSKGQLRGVQQCGTTQNCYEITRSLYS